MSATYSTVVIYSSTFCPYCTRAKNLLERKQVSYNEINLDEQRDKMPEMLEKSGGARSVPQIFIDDQHIGGCDDLYQLEAENKLDQLLFSK